MAQNIFLANLFIITSLIFPSLWYHLIDSKISSTAGQEKEETESSKSYLIKPSEPSLNKLELK